MKEPELNNKVFQKLQEFESIGSIQPSAEWNNSLMQKLTTAKPSSNTGFTSTNSVLVLSFVILANIFFVFKAITNDQHVAPSRNQELEYVSQELLFNPTSMSN